MIPYYEATDEDMKELKRREERGEVEFISVDSPRGREFLKRFCEQLGIEMENQTDDAD